MVRLKPDPENLYSCPECHAPYPEIDDIRYESTTIYVACTCALCQLKFLQTLPVGHHVSHPLSIGLASGKIYAPKEPLDWLSLAVAKAWHQRSESKVNIEKRVYRNTDTVILLNALDSIYGHALLKLYNASFHLSHHSELGLVVIVPRNLEWLIPEGCAEAWIVDLSLSQLEFGYDAIYRFVANELRRFAEVYASRAYSHPEFRTVEIEHFSRVKPFSINNFAKLSPVVTFVLREDRWWFSSIVDYWFYRVNRKLRTSAWGSRVLSRRQNRLVKKTIALLKKSTPGISVNVVGLGKTGNFRGIANDERVLKLNPAIERDWCRTYSRSHVVIGIHGSNLLLPTAHAASCVEILPCDRSGNMVQDLSVRYDGRLQLFLYRFADQYASPSSIADKVTSIIRDFPLFEVNMCQNVYTLTSANDNSEFLT
jgi:hypothetical protein